MVLTSEDSAATIGEIDQESARVTQQPLHLDRVVHASSRRGKAEEVAFPAAVPENLAQALKYDEPENEIRYHSSASGAQVGKGGRHAVIFHGQGVGIDDSKDRLLRYFQQIDRGLRDVLHDETAPLASLTSCRSIAKLTPILIC